MTQAEILRQIDGLPPRWEGVTERRERWQEIEDAARALLAEFAPSDSPVYLLVRAVAVERLREAVGG